MLSLLLVVTVSFVAYGRDKEYKCRGNGVCDISCDHQTDCKQLTIYAQNASKLMVQCADNEYCDEMTIYAAKRGRQSNISCIAESNSSDVCQNIKIYGNDSFVNLKCSGNGGEACSNGMIQSISIKPWQQFMSNITISPDTTIDAFSLSADISTIQNDGIVYDLMTNVSILTLRTVSPSTTGTFHSSQIISEQLWITSSLSFYDTKFNTKYIAWAQITSLTTPLTFYNNTVTALYLSIISNELWQFKQNKIYLPDFYMPSVIKSYGTFSQNEIYSNTSLELQVASGRMADNRIYAVSDDANNSYNLDIYVSGGNFVRNKVNVTGMSSFGFICINEDSMCSSNNDGDIYLDDVGKVSISSLEGAYFEDISIHTESVQTVKVTMNNAVLREVDLDALSADKVSIDCSVGGKQEDINSTWLCQGLNVIIPSGPNTHIHCNGILGCDQLTLYTANGDSDFDVEVDNCDCDAIQGMANFTGCIAEWDIFCDGSNTSSVLNDKFECDGKCCSHLAQQLVFPDNCSADNTKTSNDGLAWWGILLIVIGVLVAGLAILGVIQYVRQKRQNSLAELNGHLINN